MQFKRRARRAFNRSIFKGNVGLSQTESNLTRLKYYARSLLSFSSPKVFSVTTEEANDPSRVRYLYSVGSSLRVGVGVPSYRRRYYKLRAICGTGHFVRTFGLF